MSVEAIPEGPRVTPYLLYADVAAAMDFLKAAFGLEEYGERFLDSDGRVNHAAMKIGDGVIMMGCPGAAYKNPKQLGSSTESLYIYVEDVDAHFERARRAGARILQEPTDEFYGDRRYGAEDPEGHQWYFASHVRDVSFDEMKASYRPTK